MKREIDVFVEGVRRFMDPNERRKRIEERLDELEKEIEEANDQDKILLKREYRILSTWEFFESRCAKEGIVEIW